MDLENAFVFAVLSKLFKLVSPTDPSLPGYLAEQTAILASALPLEQKHSFLFAVSNSLNALILKAEDEINDDLEDDDDDEDDEDEEELGLWDDEDTKELGEDDEDEDNEPPF